jgi:hypothetical protein
MDDFDLDRPYKIKEILYPCNIMPRAANRNRLPKILIIRRVTAIGLALILIVALCFYGYFRR